MTRSSKTPQLAVDIRGIHDRPPKVERTSHCMNPPWLTQAIALSPARALALKRDQAPIARS